MKFHAVLLYIDDQFPDISIFRKLQEVGRGLYPKGAYLYSVEQKLIADRFYWMYFQYDNAKLCTQSILFSRNPSVYAKSSAVEYLTQQTEQWCIF